MYPETDACPLDDDIIQGFSAVADLIYNPSQTVLLKKAAGFGARTGKRPLYAGFPSCGGAGDMELR